MVPRLDLKLLGLFQIFFSLKSRHLSYHRHSTYLRSQNRLWRIAGCVVQTLKRISSVENFLRALMFHGEHGVDAVSDLFMSMPFLSNRLILLITLLLYELLLIFEAHVHILSGFPG